MTERQLQDAVIELARLLGWRVAHFRPAATARGWRTPVQADGAGFPDLIMVKPGSELTAYAVELKQDGKHPTPTQRQWLDWLDDGGLFTVVWREADWHSGLIERMLRADERRAA